MIDEKDTGLIIFLYSASPLLHLNERHHQALSCQH